jgi:hypothetical protein
MKAPFVLTFVVFASAGVQPLPAQFSPAFLQNDSYWGDGKAEVDFYDAQVMRDGQLRHGEMQMILAKTISSLPREPLDPSAAPLAAVPVVRLSQSLIIPRGIVNEQRASVLFFLLQGALLEADDVTTRADAIISSHVFLPPGAKELTIERSSPRGKVVFPLADQRPAIMPNELYPLPDQPPTMLRNELPLRVRMLDISKGSGEFQCRLIDPEPPGDTPMTGASSCKLTFKVQKQTVEVELPEEKGTNKFTVDRDFPFLLREWKTADGSNYHLKNSLKADYRKYLKEGDREKALKDPMLRHPD